MSESALIKREVYIQVLLKAYVELPETPSRARRLDRELAHQLYERAIPLSVIRAAFLLASARRLTRPPEAPPLQPIRSLYYFLPVIEEVLAAPFSTTYVDYLSHKLHSLVLSNKSLSERKTR